MPIQGFQRFRRHLLGVQTSFSSNTGATIWLPWGGDVQIDPQREFPDVDSGSLDPNLAPFDGAQEVTGSWEGRMDYDTNPILFAGILKGGVAPTGGGAAKTHTYTAASLTADTFAYYTDQWGDDSTSDQIIGGSGIVDSLTISFDEDNSAYEFETELLFARGSVGTATGGLSISTSQKWVYGTDTELFVDSAAGSIGTTKWTDALHTLELEINANNDVKRFANGSNTRFQAAGFGRGEREITLTLGVAKTTETIAEVATIDDGSSAVRYIDIRVTSPEIITGSTPYSMDIKMPMRLMTAEPAEFGDNNTGWELTYRAVYDTTLLYAIKVVNVSTQTGTF